MQLDDDELILMESITDAVHLAIGSFIHRKLHGLHGSR